MTIPLPGMPRHLDPSEMWAMNALRWLSKVKHIYGNRLRRIQYLIDKCQLTNNTPTRHDYKKLNKDEQRELTFYYMALDSFHEMAIKSKFFTTTIDGETWQTYSLSYHPNGKIKHGIPTNNITRTIKKQNLEFLGMKGIEFYKNGQVYAGNFAQKTILTVNCQAIAFADAKNTDNHDYNAGYTIRFYKNGDVDFGIIAEETIIQLGKMIIRATPGNGLFFYSNGILKKLETHNKKSSSEQRILLAGKYWGQTKYEFYEFPLNSNILKACLAKPTPIKVGNRNVLFNSIIRFNPDGKVSYGYLAQDTTFTINGEELLFSGDDDVIGFKNDIPVRGTIKVTDMDVLDHCLWIIGKGCIWGEFETKTIKYDLNNN
jgi:hypothetical protein